MKKEMPGTDHLRILKEITWCPGCPDHMILESSRRALLSLTKKGFKKENFAMVCGVGCHGKIFDYMNISGFYALHGRAIPTAMGIKFGNPNLNVMVFSGDGDTYSEGIAHFIHACRTNPNITLIVNNNQAFSLTTGQATVTSQLGYKTKAEPLGAVSHPINPIHLALSTGASFVARCNARDIEHTQLVIEKAMAHKGFSFVEILQDCIVFNLEVNERDKHMYKLPDKKRSLKKALALAGEFDYNLNHGKIPLGVFYEDNRESLEEKWPQLVRLMKARKGWKGVRR